MIIKVCGMRDPENIRKVASLGVNWIGVIFFAGSPRRIFENGKWEYRLPQFSIFNSQLKMYGYEKDIVFLFSDTSTGETEKVSLF